MNKMAPIIYQCSVCKLCVISINDLHAHHTENHTVAELSNALIDLRGFKCIQLTFDHFITDHTDPVIHDNCHTATSSESSSGNLVELVANNHKAVDCEKSTNSVSPKINIANSEELQTWESELSKNTAISEEDFLECVTGLCNDLANKKRKVRRNKGKLRQSIIKDSGNKENICIDTEIRENTVVHKDFTETCTLQSADDTNYDVIEILCNSLNGDFYDASDSQMSNAEHENSEIALIESYLISTSDEMNEHVVCEQVALDDDAIVTFQN